MRRLIVLFVFVALVIGGGWWLAAGAGKAVSAETGRQLAALGFKQVAIADTDLSPRSTTLDGVSLDRENIDHIDSITVARGWLSWLLGGSGDITVQAPDIYRNYDHVNALLPGLMLLNRDTLAGMPDVSILVRDGRLNITTPLGLFQFVYSIVIEPYGDKDRRLVHATIKSAERTMAFETEWRGWIGRDGAILLDAFIPELKADIGSLRVTRGNGWISLASTDKYPALSGQIESGGASLGTLPLQNFSLTWDASRGGITALARAQASGAPDTRFAADVSLGEVDKKVEFTLSTHNLAGMFTYIETHAERAAGNLRQVFAGQDQASLAIDYQMAKRFAGGPYPFDMRGLLRGDEEFLSGTFLVYPGTFDLKGSAKVAPKYLKGIADYFKLPDDMVSGDYLRMDASLAPLFSGVGAGIENNPGE